MSRWGKKWMAAARGGSARMLVRGCQSKVGTQIIDTVIIG